MKYGIMKFAEISFNLRTANGHVLPKQRLFFSFNGGDFKVYYVIIINKGPLIFKTYTNIL